MLDLKELIISPESVGKTLILTDIVPGYEYVNGVRSGEVSFFKYVVTMKDKKYEKLTVRIEGSAQLEMADGEDMYVAFEGLVLSLYWTPNGHQIAAKATAIKKVNKNR